MRRLLIGSFLAASLVAGPAAAFDTGNPAADAFVSMFFTPGDQNATVGSVSQDGDTLTVSDVAINFGQGTQVSGGIKFDNATITGLTQTDNTFTAEQVQLTGTNVNLTDTEDASMPISMTYSSDRETIQNVRFTPGAMSVEPTSAQAYFEAFTNSRSENVTLSFENAFSIAVPAIVMEQSVGADGGAMRGQLTVNDAVVTIAPGVPVPPELTQVLPQPMTLDISSGLTFNPTGGVVSFEDLTIGVQDAGKLVMSLALSNLPGTFFSTQTSDAQMNAIMAAANFNGFSLSLDDEGVAERALSVAAQQQGTTADAVRASINQSAAGMLMMMVGDQNLAQSASNALASLLNGGGMTVSAEPSAPVQIGAIIGGAMTNPADLISTLNVQVESR